MKLYRVRIDGKWDDDQELSNRRVYIAAIDYRNAANLAESWASDCGISPTGMDIDIEEDPFIWKEQ